MRKIFFAIGMVISYVGFESAANAEDRPPIRIGTGSPPQKSYVEKYCLKFQQIPKELIGQMIGEMEATPYPVDEYFKIPECQAKGYSEAVKSPVTHYIADAPETRQDFLNRIWLYYSKKRQQPEIFTEILNARNTQGETLLDYLESLRVKGYNSISGLQPSLRKIIDFACAHGGGYAYYPLSCDEAQNVSLLASQIRLADGGDIIAMRKVGEAYRFGISTSKDPRKAFQYFEMAANSGNRDAMKLLASLLHGGIDGFGADARKAVSIYEKLGSYSEVAFLYKYGGTNLAKNSEEAYRWSLKAYESGEASALPDIVSYYEEIGDKRKAFEWTRLMVESPYSGYHNETAVKEKGRLTLARYYFRGIGTAPDLKRSIFYQREYLVKYGSRRDWYEYVDDDAGPDWLSIVQGQARQGNSHAQFLMAVYWDRDFKVIAGKRVPLSDYALAVEWFRKAALQGDPESQYEYSVHLSLGKGIAVDERLAAEWLRKAAEGGHHMARVQLGMPIRD